LFANFSVKGSRYRLIGLTSCLYLDCFMIFKELETFVPGNPAIL
jgi:hypothetical protein